jgi:two-component system, chemotaxis family, protein-glutamate methylesterase/glutaminase
MDCERSVLALAAALRASSKGATLIDMNTELIRTGPQREPEPLRVIAIGGSADGFVGLTAILRAFPADLPAAVVITQHVRRGRRSLLAKLLSRQCKLRVKEAAADEQLQPSTVYLAPADHHLVVDDHHLSVTQGPPVNFSRPSIDVTFNSVASACGPNAIGVVLSGGGRDGAKGLRAIKDAGGFTIVQDPRDARVAAMPLQALAADHVDFKLPLLDIGPTLVRLVSEMEDGRVEETVPTIATP